MKERPILFSAPTVRALLDGRKTQTRRIVKIEMPNCEISSMHPTASGDGWIAWAPKPVSAELTAQTYPTGGIPCPYGKPRDQLWVKETFNKCACLACKDSWPKRATNHAVTYCEGHKGHSGLVWTPSIFMPRWASRITLEVTEVRVQRLQEISEGDAASEGIKEPVPVHGSWVDPRMPGRMGHWSFRKPFSELWESINGADSWDANPWVWAVSFKLVTA